MKSKLAFGLAAAIAMQYAIAADPVSALRQACVGLQTHAADVTLDAPVQQEADQTSQRVRGWKQVHTIKGVVSTRPSSKVAGDFKAAGQRCQFDVSIDLKTVAVAKTACMALCKGVPFTRFRDEGRAYLAYFGIDGSRELMK